jgi:hypothetical protein
MLRFFYSVILMSTKYFSVEEANALLPKIEPLMKRLLARRAQATRRAQDLMPILEDLRSNVGGPTASELMLDFMAIEQLVDKIHSYGCLIKDLNGGLLDFLSERNGREVYLCWRYGEPQIEYYHELHTGFSGRRKL